MFVSLVSLNDTDCIKERLKAVTLFNLKYFTFLSASNKAFLAEHSEIFKLSWADSNSVIWCFSFSWKKFFNCLITAESMTCKNGTVAADLLYNAYVILHMLPY